MKYGLLALTGLLALSAAPAPSTFERFKALAGDWVAVEGNDMVKAGDLVARYHLTGAGSAVVEDLLPGTPHQMTTVYHLDGSDVVLTHYCALGNQPRMRARTTASNRVEFAFDGGTNVDPAHGEYMRSATVEFVSADEIRTEWIEYAAGKEKMTVRMHLVRKTR